jgi:hypothetical protein
MIDRILAVLTLMTKKEKTKPWKGKILTFVHRDCKSSMGSICYAIKNGRMVVILVSATLHFPKLSMPEIT